MSRYLVTFFKRLSNSDGHEFNCPQQSIEIRRAKSVDRAVEAAERRYERLCNLPDWTLHADTRELQVDGRTVGDRITVTTAAATESTRSMRRTPAHSRGAATNSKGRP